MSETWELEDAGRRIDELVRRAQVDGPQLIGDRGENCAVVLSAAEYARLRGSQRNMGERTGRDFIELLRKSPLYGIDLDLERNREQVPPPMGLTG